VASRASSAIASVNTRDAPIARFFRHQQDIEFSLDMLQQLDYRTLTASVCAHQLVIKKQRDNNTRSLVRHQVHILSKMPKTVRCRQPAKHKLTNVARRSHCDINLHLFQMPL
jgi:hypothetical protein